MCFHNRRPHRRGNILQNDRHDATVCRFLWRDNGTLGRFAQINTEQYNNDNVNPIGYFTGIFGTGSRSTNQRTTLVLDAVILVDTTHTALATVVDGVRYSIGRRRFIEKANSLISNIIEPSIYVHQAELKVPMYC